MDFFGTQKRPFLRKSHFFLSSRAAFISNENFHISLAHWSHDELSHFDSRHAAHGNTKGLWAPLKMLLEQWVKTTFTQSNGVAHSPFFSCSRSLSRSLIGKDTFISNDAASWEILLRLWGHGWTEDEPNLRMRQYENGPDWRRSPSRSDDELRRWNIRIIDESQERIAIYCWITGSVHVDWHNWTNGWILWRSETILAMHFRIASRPAFWILLTGGYHEPGMSLEGKPFRLELAWRHFFNLWRRLRMNPLSAVFISEDLVVCKLFVWYHFHF